MVTKNLTLGTRHLHLMIWIFQYCIEAGKTTDERNARVMIDQLWDRSKELHVGEKVKSFGIGNLDFDVLHVVAVN